MAHCRRTQHWNLNRTAAFEHHFNPPEFARYEKNGVPGLQNTNR
jgi:hypothetical protein